MKPADEKIEQFVCHLDDWAIVGNVLMGFCPDHPTIPKGHRGITGAIVYIDRLNNEAVTMSQKIPGKFLRYKLNQEGHPSMHVNNPELMQPPKAESLIMLKPNG